MDLWTFLSPIEKPYYCGVLYVGIITDPVGKVFGKQEVGDLNPNLPRPFFSPFSVTSDKGRYQLEVYFQFHFYLRVW